MRLRVLDIDGSVAVQPVFAEAVATGRAQVVNLRAEEKAFRLWTSGRRLARLARRLDASGDPPGNGPLVTFYGSGDYHHVGASLIAGITEPVTVVQFDNHPDWVRWPPTWNCGGWVSRVLALPQVSRVVTLGPCSDDLVRPQVQGGDLAALASGRLELYPWHAPPSRVWGGIGDGPGHARIGRHLVWRCLDALDWPAFLSDLAVRLPTEAVWITIDKDVLGPTDAATNWDQGRMPLAALLVALRHLAATRRIVGIDVCGEYSPPRFNDPLKRLEAWRDHPTQQPEFKAATALNDRTNQALLATLAEVLP